MVSLAESSKQRAGRTSGGSAVERMTPAAPRENMQGRMFTIDPLSLSIVHDLRNPLAAICMSAEMLTHPSLTPDHAERLGRNLHKAAGRMRELLADLVCVNQGRMAT